MPARFVGGFFKDRDTSVPISDSMSGIVNDSRFLRPVQTPRKSDTPFRYNLYFVNDYRAVKGHKFGASGLTGETTTTLHSTECNTIGIETDTYRQAISQQTID